MPENVDSTAFVKLGDAARAPIISYNVPQPSQYTGRNYLELNLPDDIWTDEARDRRDIKVEPSPNGENIRKVLDSLKRMPIGEFGPRETEERIRKSSGEYTPAASNLPGVDTASPATLDVINSSAVSDRSDVTTVVSKLASSPQVATMIKETPSEFFKLAEMSLALEENQRPTRLSSSTPFNRLVDELGEETVVQRIRDGYTIREQTDMNGKISWSLVLPAGSAATPRLALAETYRLSNYLGNYGAGRTVQTFSLLPGEQTKIAVKSYTKTTESTKEASSIFDSYEDQHSAEFSSDIQSESSQTSSKSDKFGYHAEAKVGANWGWGNAEISGGIAGETASAREEFSKNVSSATQKHAAKAASKRTMQVDTSKDTSKEAGSEYLNERTIQNINVGRTLNFVFRQMNQEFISILHLVDVRLCFHNGDVASYNEVALPQLRSLLKRVIKPEKVDEVENAVIESLSHIYDYQGAHRSFIEKRTMVDGSGSPILNVATGQPQAYYRVPLLKDTYEPATHNITVEGIIMRVTVVTLPTEGLIVEALIGQGDALDTYSHGLQDEAVEAEDLKNKLVEGQVKRETMALSILEDIDLDRAQRRAEMFAMLYPAQKAESDESDAVEIPL